MASSSNFVVGLTILILCWPAICNGLRCYECKESASEYGGCAEPFKRTKVAAKDCPNAPDQACLKTVTVHREGEHSVAVYERKCVSQNVYNLPMGCVPKEQLQPGTIESCLCNTSECNGSTVIKFGRLVLLGLVVLSFIVLIGSRV